MSFASRSVRGPVLFLLASAALAGCAAAPQHVSYPVEPTPPAYSKEGIASWYGPGFHGRKTASGERYNQRDLTCAHRTLPFGTRLKVTNLSNGEALILTVNDRGPYIKNRIVDLSREAARRLDILHEGTAHVRLETVSPEDEATDGMRDPLPLEASNNASSVDPD